MLRYDRAIKRLERRWRRNAMLQHLHVAGRTVVYAGLLHYARGQRKPNGRPWNVAGWARHAFEEIFGDWPRQRDYGPPQANPLIEEWVTLRPKRKRK
jgi:hypothetical protein